MTDLNSKLLEEALATLGEVLTQRRAPQEIALIGGSGLLLLGTVERTTHDVDVVALVSDGRLSTATPLPPALRDAALDVARALDLGPHWFNSGPTSLLDFGLPAGFLSRCEERRYGSLVVHVAGRLDQIHFKLYAATDMGPRSKHMSDLRALAPSSEELLTAARWCRGHDPSEGFLHSLRAALAFLEVKVSDEDL